MLRKCTGCGLEAHFAEDLDLFCKTASYPHGRQNRCKACNNARGREFEKKRREKEGTSMRNDRTLREYGCTLEQYKERMATSASCLVCETTENLVYDHCHDTMEFRGVLCRCCNGAIGKLGDNAKSLRRALAYLERSEARIIG